MQICVRTRGFDRDCAVVHVEHDSCDFGGGDGVVGGPYQCPFEELQGPEDGDCWLGYVAPLFD